jgi:hypothetical protein
MRINNLRATALIFLFAFSVFAQPASEWVEFKSDNGEILISLPGTPSYFFDEAGFFIQELQPQGRTFTYKNVQILNANLGDTYMSVEIYRVPSSKDHLDHLLKGRFYPSDKSDKKESKSGNVLKIETDFGKDVIDDVKKRTGQTVDFAATYIATKTHVYAATVWSRGVRNADFERFLSSIRLTADVAATKVEPISISSLTPITVGDVVRQLSGEQTKLLPDDPENDPKRPGSLVVLQRPWAGNYVPVNNMVSKGKVKLYVEHNRNGNVSKVDLISGGSGYMHRLAVFSALRSKFLPELHNGNTVTVGRHLTYRF